MKIAIVGTAPSSLGLAPFNDPEWEIWACGPAYRDVLKKVDVWFEIHDFGRLKQDGTLDNSYLEWLKKVPKVYTQKVLEQIPGSIEYPLEEMVGLYGPHFFTSTVSYMIALAISKNPEAIGFWGIDMAATEEYAAQRTGCHFFIQEARKKNIEIVIPPQSDLLRTNPLYGFKESGWMWKKLSARRTEFENRLADAKQRKRQAQYEEDFLTGALEDLDYIMRIWI